VKAVAETDLIEIVISVEVTEAEEIMVVISLEDRGDQGDKGRVVRGGVRQVPQWQR
jgi:hypothetical protein